MFYIASEICHELVRSVLSWMRYNPQRAKVCGIALSAIVIVTVFKLVSWALFHQPTVRYGFVRGYLRCAKGDPVTNVWVVFANDAAGVGATAKTDHSGYFTAEGVQPGVFTVYIQPDVNAVGRPVSFADVSEARENLEPLVPRKFQAAETSPITAEMGAGTNNFDIDLSKM